MCIIPKGLKHRTDCPPENQGVVAEKCVAKYIARDMCIAAKGTWTGFITNYLERTAGVLTPMSDQDRISPYNINAISTR